MGQDFFWRFSVSDPIHKRIKDARIAKGFSQSKLGDLIGVGKGNVSGWESGKYGPNKQNLAALAKALDKSEGWLAGYNSSEPMFKPEDTPQPHADLIGGVMLNWETVVRVVELLLECPQAKGLSAAQRAEAAKRLHAVGVKDPGKLKAEIASAIVLSLS